MTKALTLKTTTLSTLVLLGLLCAPFYYASYRAVYGHETPNDKKEELTTEKPEAPPIKGIIDSLGIFKNGVVVVRERYQIPKAGRYNVATPPSPIHGTFFIQSEATVEATLSHSEYETPIEGEKIDWSVDFRGRWLRIVTPDEKEARIARVIQVEKTLKTSTNDQHTILLPSIPL